MPVFNGLYRLQCAGLHIVNDLLDFRGGRCRALGESSYLIGNYRETASGLASTSSLDGGVQR